MNPPEQPEQTQDQNDLLEKSNESGADGSRRRFTATLGGAPSSSLWRASLCGPTNVPSPE